MDEAGELVATPGAGAADGVVHEPPQDAEAVISRPALDRCFLVGKRVVIVHAFVKKTEQTPDKKLALARKRAKEVQNG